MMSNHYKAILNMGKVGNPRTFIQALLSNSGNRPAIRMVEQNGAQYFQISSQMADAEAEEEEEEVVVVNSAEAPHGSDLAPTPSIVHDEQQDEQDNSSTIQQSPIMETAEQVARPPPPSTSEENLEDSMYKDDPDPVGNAMCRGHLPVWGPENCGAAAIVAVVIGGPNPYVVTANAGDSRCVLSRNGVAVALSQDHKPFLPGELDRITKAGGSVRTSVCFVDESIRSWREESMEI